MNLAGRVALVTGGSRGVGRGIARGLGECGATVYVTGRTAHAGGGPPAPGTLEHVAQEIERAGGRAVPVRCDHSSDDDIASLFARIADEAGRLDVLVNNVHSGVHDIADNAGRRFWETPPDYWDRMNHVGLRAHYVAAVHAARMMVGERRGLIVNVSSFGSVAYLFDLAYGVGKAALDRMTADMAVELRPFGVAAVSLYPGLVWTELTGSVMQDATPGYRRIFEAYGEAPIVSGRALAALAADPDALRFSGRVVVAAELARRRGLRGEHGERPVSPRALRLMARAALPGRLRWAAALVPARLYAPRFMVGPVLVRFSQILKANGGLRGPAGTTA